MKIRGPERLLEYHPGTLTFETSESLLPILLYIIPQVYDIFPPAPYTYSGTYTNSSYSLPSYTLLSYTYPTPYPPLSPTLSGRLSLSVVPPLPKDASEPRSICSILSSRDPASSKSLQVIQHSQNDDCPS